jgi:hypothetical protein
VAEDDARGFGSALPLGDQGGSPTAQGVVMNLANVWVVAGLALLYPLFRILGLAVQRRFREVERRLMGGRFEDRSRAGSRSRTRAPHKTLGCWCAGDASLEE